MTSRLTKLKLATVAVVTGLMAVMGAGLASASSGGTVWDRLAQCESTGNFSNRDTGGNGHYGGFQFSPATWASVGGSGNPADASPGEQLLRAKILLSQSGPGQWQCASTAGLTRANGAAEGLSGVGGGSTTPAVTPIPKTHTAPPAATRSAPRTPPAAPVHHEAPAVQSVSSGTYTVKPGDTLSEIASANGTTWHALYKANARTIGANPDVIYPGQVLTLP